MRGILRGQRGQTLTEMVFLLPLLAALAGAMACVGYLCWQALKTEQAAVLAGQIVGQERVGGGFNVPAIQRGNGFNFGGVQATEGLPPGFGERLDADAPAPALPRSGVNDPRRWAPNSVYAKYYDAVRRMFGSREQEHLYIPQPHPQSLVDTVEIQRVFVMPEIFRRFFKPLLVVRAQAAGSGDTWMHGLPRWGYTSPSGASRTPSQNSSSRGAETPDWQEDIYTAPTRHPPRLTRPALPHNTRPSGGFGGFDSEGIGAALPSGIAGGLQGAGSAFGSGNQLNSLMGGGGLPGVRGLPGLPGLPGVSSNFSLNGWPKLPMNQVTSRLKSLSPGQLTNFLKSLSAPQLGSLLNRLPAQELGGLLSRMPTADLSRIVGGLPTSQLSNALSRLPVDQLSFLRSRLPRGELSDRIGDLLKKVPAAGAPVGVSITLSLP